MTIALGLRKLGGNGPHNVAKQFEHGFPLEKGFFLFPPRCDEVQVFLIFFFQNKENNRLSSEINSHLHLL